MESISPKASDCNDVSLLTPLKGAKLFNLSGITHGSYSKTEIHNLGRFISVMKFRPLKWRTTHPHIFADR